jgi:cyclopropane-fatty-acyl-phospholipid synthase
MLYRFKSQATADLVMLNDTGEQMLAAMGKTVAPQGVITVAQIPAALAALAQAVADSEAVASPEDDTDVDDAPKADTVRLRQRTTPLVAMLKESLAAGKDVVWGV